MEYDVKPGHGVGPLIHGMTRDLVRATLGEPDRCGVENFEDSEPIEIWEYEKEGIDAWFAREDDWRLGTVTVCHQEAAIRGMRFINLPESELAVAASEAGLGTVVLEDDFEEFGRDYQCEEQCVSFWVQEGVVVSLTTMPRYADDGDTILWPDSPAT